MALPGPSGPGRAGFEEPGSVHNDPKRLGRAGWDRKALGALGNPQNRAEGMGKSPERLGRGRRAAQKRLKARRGPEARRDPEAFGRAQKLPEGRRGAWKGP